MYMLPKHVQPIKNNKSLDTGPDFTREWKCYYYSLTHLLVLSCHVHIASKTLELNNIQGDRIFI